MVPSMNTLKSLFVVIILSASSAVYAQFFNVYGPLSPKQVGFGCAPLLCGNSSLTYDITTGNYFEGSLTSGLQATWWLTSNGAGSVTDQHGSFAYNDPFGLHFGTVPDNLINGTNPFSFYCSLPASGTQAPECFDFLAIQRQVNSGDCLQGTTINAYYACRVVINTDSGNQLDIIFGPLNPPGASGSKDIGARFRCFMNDSCGFLAGNHNEGSQTETYSWDYFYTGGGTADRYGTMFERVPVSASSAGSAQRVPHCTGYGTTISAPFECWMTSPGNFYWQISDGGASSDIGGPLNGTTWLHAQKTASTSEARITLGDTANATSSTTVACPSQANCLLNVAGSTSPIAGITLTGQVWSVPNSFNNNSIRIIPTGLSFGTRLQTANPGSSANNTFIFPNYSGTDTGAVLAAIQTFSNKSFSTPVILPSYSVATLPTCSGSVNTYGTAVVNDALAPTYLGALTGGSTNVTKVLCNGASWVSD
jgi:hypothetical protein